VRLRAKGGKEKGKKENLSRTRELQKLKKKPFFAGGSRDASFPRAPSEDRGQCSLAHSNWNVAKRSMWVVFLRRRAPRNPAEKKKKRGALWAKKHNRSGLKTTPSGPWDMLHLAATACTPGQRVRGGRAPCREPRGNPSRDFGVRPLALGGDPGRGWKVAELLILGVRRGGGGRLCGILPMKASLGFYSMGPNIGSIDRPNSGRSDPIWPL